MEGNNIIEILIGNAIETMIKKGKSDKYIRKNLEHILDEYYGITLYGFTVDDILKNFKN